jgi:hypothetical protein
MAPRLARKLAMLYVPFLNFQVVGFFFCQPQRRVPLIMKSQNLKITERRSMAV